MDDVDNALVTTLRGHGRRHNDVLDLAAALALHLLPGKREEEGWLGREDPEAEGASLLAAIDREMPAVPGKAISFLEEAGLSSLDVARRAYAIVDAVDHIVGSRAHPCRPPITLPWTSLLNRLRDLGRYNLTESLGSIIPAPYNKGKAIRDPYHIGRRLRFTRPIHPYVLRYAWISGLPDWPDPEWPVALVPVPHRPGAASHQPVRGLGTPHYEIQHAYTDDDRRNLREALREIEARGDIPLGLFPEAALDQAGMKDLSDEFVRLSDAGPGLQLVMFGHSGGKQGHNAFTVVKRGGIAAWDQAKLNSYNLKNETIRRDHLQLPLLSSEDDCYRELLATSVTPAVTVADTPYGRLMIAICEDVGHLRPSTETAVEGRVTHLIAPLLNRELNRGGWYDDRVRSLSRETGCTGVVCTSAFLERHVRSKTGGSVDAPVTVLLIHRPPWNTSPTTQKWDPSRSQLWVEDRCPSAGSNVT